METLDKLSQIRNFTTALNCIASRIEDHDAALGVAVAQMAWEIADRVGEIEKALNGGNAAA